MRQQIVISGFGGQGVVFLTRLITETALLKGFSIFSSETHGMAQRGGNVVSHVKIYEDRDGAEKFWSPLIRPGNADLLIALHPDAVTPYRYLLKKGGTIVCNTAKESVSEFPENTVIFDANSLALRLGNHRMANVILLGFVASRGYLLCSLDDFIRVSEESRNLKLLEALKSGVQPGND